MNKIAVIGSGYVGLVSGTCLADFGMEVTCVDNNSDKIEMLKKGIIPIYEPELSSMVEKNVYYKRLNFTTDIKKAVRENEVIFIAVGTPPTEDGSADLQSVMEVAWDIAKYMNGYKVIVDKSTVPVGTGRKVKQIIGEALKNKGAGYDFDVVSNPEFLKEGAAIRDFTHPDRVVLGAESERAIERMKEVYKVLHMNEVPFLITNIETAELIKYASNAFLATRITFINELTELCEKVGANIQQVSKGMGMDKRIGPKFLNAGPGYGGSCFPKDIQALLKTGRDYGCELSIIDSTIKANDNQKLRMINKILSIMGNVEGKTICVLGLAFKPETDDMREAPALTIIKELFRRGADFKVYDPRAFKEAKWRFEEINNSITYCDDEYIAAKDADALIIITEWSQFKNLNLEKIRKSMKDSYFFDFRNIYDPVKVSKMGFKYYSIGRSFGPFSEVILEVEAEKSS